MLPALISIPPPKADHRHRSDEGAEGAASPTRSVAHSKTRVRTAAEADTSKRPERKKRGTGQAAEERFLIITIAVLLVTLLLPAILMMAFLIFNPDAFQTTLTPARDLSSWVPGQRP